MAYALLNSRVAFDKFVINTQQKLIKNWCKTGQKIDKICTEAFPSRFPLSRWIIPPTTLLSAAPPTSGSACPTRVRICGSTHTSLDDSSRHSDSKRPLSNQNGHYRRRLGPPLGRLRHSELVICSNYKKQMQQVVERRSKNSLCTMRVYKATMWLSWYIRIVRHWQT